MKKRVLKKSEVLREGYVKGLKEAKNIIQKILTESDEEAVDWDDIKRAIADAVSAELVEKSYDDYNDLRENGEVDEIVETVFSNIRARYTEKDIDDE